jgi:predicted nucleotidyltransferase
MEALSAVALEKIRVVLARHPEVTSAVLFGSRAKGTHREASDIDLALEGDLSSLQAESIEAELEELFLPQTFDLCVVGNVPESVRQHIERVGVTIFP